MMTSSVLLGVLSFSVLSTQPTLVTTRVTEQARPVKVEKDTSNKDKGKALTEKQKEREAARAKAQEKRLKEKQQRYAQTRLRSRMDILSDEMTLEEVLNQWREQTQVNLVVNWSALEEGGITRDTLISVNLKNVRASVVLNQVMLLARGDMESGSLLRPAVDLKGGILTLTTLHKLLDNSVSRVYDVRELLVEKPNFKGPSFNLNDALKNTNTGGSQGGGSGGGMINTDDAEEEKLTPEEKAEKLVEMVTKHIMPEIWQENGADTPCTVSFQRGMLIVRAPEFVQKQIGLPAIRMK